MSQSSRLQKILQDRGYLDTASPSSARESGDERAWLDTLLSEQRITPEQVAEVLAEALSLEQVSLEEFTIPESLYAVLPAKAIYRYRVVPYAVNDGVLQVAVAYPFNFDLPEQLEYLTGQPVELTLTTPAAIDTALTRSQGTSELLRDISDAMRVDDQVPDADSGMVTDEESGPVVKLVNSILLDALSKRASDIHLETRERWLEVKYRVDGVLYPQVNQLNAEHHDALVSRIKVMAELDIAERRTPQDGRFKQRLDGRVIDFRVSVLPGIFGEDVVIRILDKSSITDGIRNLNLDHLGLRPELLKQFRKAVHEPYGMVLITGPTGSGKTTTLYAALSEINTGEEKIITIEDPVEYQLPGILQIPVNEKKNLTFSKGLRSILRHDPDKIMVGEIRDSETVQIAVQSALTGHLVFTTVHANNSFDVIGRFAHMGVDINNFVSALNCVLAQRLVRTICPQCKTEVEVDDELLERSGLDRGTLNGQKFYTGKGCAHCGQTGYRGRSAITELLQMTPALREMIVNRCAPDELERHARAQGMTTLRESAMQKVLAGETTLAEINRVTFVE